VWGLLGDTPCPFELLDYTGPLSYTPGSNSVSAFVSLAQTGDTNNTMEGPIVFDKSPSDRFNELTNEPGVWTNAASQTLSFDGELFTRVPRWPTNYAGYVFFADGDPSTPSPDYELWVLSINDTNDANANGIPDFSDDPPAVAPGASAKRVARAWHDESAADHWRGCRPYESNPTDGFADFDELANDADFRIDE